jgi:voltage-gated potassium channel
MELSKASNAWCDWTTATDAGHDSQRPAHTDRGENLLAASRRRRYLSQGLKKTLLRRDLARASSVSTLFFWHFASRMAPWIIGLVAYLLLATVVLRWDMARSGEPIGDFGADLYGMYTQIFFEPTRELPRAPIARAVFWITPLLGAGLILRGVVRVGSSLFDAEERHKLWVKIMSDRMKDHIIVCGLGHVGIRVVESLGRLGAPVLAIEKNKNDSFAAVVEELGFPVLYGDVRRDALLIEAGVQRARSIVCATDDDLANLEVAIDAKKENPSIRVVMRMFDQRVANKMRTALDLEETFSTSALSGPLVALQATEPGVCGVYHLEDGTMRVDMEVPAPSAWWGRTVVVCEDAVDGRIVGIRKAGGSYVRPRHDMKVVEGDVLTLDLPAQSVAKLRSSSPG